MSRLGAYAREMSANGNVERTVKMKVESLRALAERYPNKQLEKLTRKDITTHISERREKYAHNTVEKEIMHISQYYRWLGKTQGRKVAGLKPKFKARELDPNKLLTWRDVEQLISVCSVRDSALLTVLFDSGVRLGELRAMNVGDVEMKGGMAELRVRESKTQTRNIPVGRAVPYLTTWLRTHPQGKDDDAPLWLSSQRTRLTQNSIDYILKRKAKQSGLNRRIYPHLFRHSRATECARMNWNESQMRKMFGWARTSNMPSYYTHLVDGDVENQVRRDMGIGEPEEDEAIGQPNRVKCEYCDTMVPVSFTFCTKCGVSLTESADETVAEMMDMMLTENTSLKEKVARLEEKLSVVMDYVQKQNG